MPSTLSDLVRRAKAGEPVFINTVREIFSALPQEEALPISAALRCLNGDVRVFAVRLPLFFEAGEEEKAFVVEYFLAEMFNMLSGLGGRAVVLHCPGCERAGEFLLNAFREEFGVGLSSDRRGGYGACLNVIDRMLPALGLSERFEISLSGDPAPAEMTYPVACPPDGASGVFRRAAEGLAGRTLLGVDIGGTDIKLVLAVDGRLEGCREFDWNPADMTTAAEFIYPVERLVELMAWVARARRDDDAALREMLDPALERGADLSVVLAVLREAGERYGVEKSGVLFDGIGMSFPDVVVGNKIVGGETTKTRGMRARWGSGYDAEFAGLTHLDKILRGHVRTDGAVGIINDGPMAAFTTGVESAATEPDLAREGVFAHTLGTELGTGWVTEAGAFPDIPLEVYNFIVDLGSYPEREFSPDDVRGIRNVNSKLPGTLQRYAGQSGVFRLAFKHLPAVRPDVIAEIRRRGFVVECEGGSYRVPVSPVDMRKPFLEFMMEAVEKESDPALHRIFEEIGVSLAVTGIETNRLLRPLATRRTLFGRLVKRPACFALMRRGAAGCDPDADFAAADEALAGTALMRELGRSGYTVAQFAQAVGAVYFANYLLVDF